MSKVLLLPPPDGKKIESPDRIIVSSKRIEMMLILPQEKYMYVLYGYNCISFRFTACIVLVHTCMICDAIVIIVHRTQK